MEELGARQSMHKDCESKAEATVDLAYTAEATPESTPKSLLLDLPPELLLEIICLVIATPDPSSDKTRTLPGADYAIDGCPYENVAFHVLNVGHSCRRLHDMLPQALLTASACRVDIPRHSHSHGYTGPPTISTHMREEQLRKVGHTLLPPPKKWCSKTLDDTPVFKRLGSQIVLAIHVLEPEAMHGRTDEYWWLVNVFEALHGCQSLKKVTLQLHRIAAWSDDSGDPIVSKAADVVRRTLHHIKLPLEVNIWGFAGPDDALAEDIVRKRLFHRVFVSEAE